MPIKREEATLKLVVDTGAAESALDRFGAKLTSTGASAGIAGGLLGGALVAGATTAVSAISSLIDVVGELGGELVSMAEDGDMVSDVYHNLRISVHAAQEATGHEVSRRRLGIVANKAMVAELRLTSDSYADIARFAKRAGDATGRDFGDVVETVVRALSTGRTRTLKDFGIFLKENTNRAKLLADGLEYMRRRSEEMGEGIETAGDAVSRINHRMEDFTDELKRAYTEDKHLVFAMGELDSAFASSGVEAAALGHLVAKMAAMVVFQIAEIMKAWNRFAVSPAGRAALGMIGIGQTDPWANRQAGMRLTGRPLDIGRSLGSGRPSIGAPAGGAEDEPYPEPVIHSSLTRQPGERGGRAAQARPGSDAFSLGEANERKIAALRAMEEENATNAIVEQRQREMDADDALHSVEREMYEASRLRREAEYEMLQEQWRINDEETLIAQERVARQQEMLDAVLNYTDMAGQALGGFSQLAASIEEQDIQKDTNARLRKTDDAGKRAKIEEEGQAKLLKVRQAAEVRQLLITAAVEAVAAAVSFASIGGIPQGIMHTIAAALALATAASLGGSGAGGVGSVGKVGRGAGGGSGSGSVGGRGSDDRITNITVMIDAAGGVVQDSQLRRLGEYVAEANRRGYVGGRR